jgi:hypothetical protein
MNLVVRPPKVETVANPRLDAALDLARHGFRVFPLQPNSKVPSRDNWQKRATTDKATIINWFSGDGAKQNIAVTTDGLCVPDIDPRNGGDTTWDAIQMVEDIPTTACSVTQSGGFHLIYKAPPGITVRNSKSKLGRGIDIKGNGGYIVAPGSMIDGRPYRWAPGGAPDDRPIAEAPDWLIAAASAPLRRSAAAGQRVVDEDDTAITQAEAYVRERAPAAEQGERDNTAFKVAAKLFDYGVSEPTAFELLQWWNDNKCQPPLDEQADLERIVDSAQRNRSRAIGSAHPDAPGFEAVEIAERYTGDKLQVGRFYAVRADEGAEQARKDKDRPLIKGMLSRGGLSVMVGAPKSGKTFFALHWAYHVAAAKDWAGRRVHGGAVVYLAAEAGRMVMRRLLALEQQYGPLTALPLFIIPCGADLVHGPDDTTALIKLVRDVEGRSKQKVELIVIDTLARAMSGGDENSSQDVGALIASADRLRETGAHVMLVHHFGKDKSRGGRGHSSVLGALDTQMFIENHTLTVTDQRDMDCVDPVHFKLRPMQVGVDEDGEPVTSCCVEISDKPAQSERRLLTVELAALLDKLKSRVHDECATSRQEPAKYKFGWQLASQCLVELKSQDASNLSAVKGASRQTASGKLTKMMESGAVKKVGRNQWVMCP